MGTIKEVSVSNQIKLPNQVEPSDSTKQDAGSEQTPFFVRRLQRLPAFKTNIRAGTKCAVDDE